MDVWDQELVNCLGIDTCPEQLQDRHVVNETSPISLRNPVPAMRPLKNTLLYPNSNLYLLSKLQLPTTLSRYNLFSFLILTLSGTCFLSPWHLQSGSNCITILQDAFRLHRQNEILCVASRIRTDSLQSVAIGNTQGIKHRTHQNSQSNSKEHLWWHGHPWHPLWTSLLRIRTTRGARKTSKAGKNMQDRLPKLERTCRTG